MRVMFVAFALCLLAGAAAAQQRPAMYPYASAPDFSAGPVKIDLSKSRDLDNWLAVQAELKRRRGRGPVSEEFEEETERLRQLDRQYSLRWFPRQRSQATYFGTCIIKLVNDCLTCEVRPNIYVEVSPDSVEVGQMFGFRTTRQAEFVVYPDGVEYAITAGARFEMMIGGYVELERIK